ncbi:MAG: hypothetical protein IJI04_07825 [Lachnospiraceae bacterium]|nr:hypothetical protein [Lachnospiraceae bacterium]
MSAFKKNPYETIINHPHFVSTKYPSMPMEKRAAQFSPFKAMVGYDDEVEEESRFTHSEIFMDENRIEELDERMRTVAGKVSAGERPVVTITHFVPDDRKEGGEYVVTEGRVRRIDEITGVLVLTDGRRIEIGRITEVAEKSD